MESKLNRPATLAEAHVSAFSIHDTRFDMWWRGDGWTRDANQAKRYSRLDADIAVIPWHQAGGDPYVVVVPTPTLQLATQIPTAD